MKPPVHVETICKLYLELANVVPAGCVSARETDLQKRIDDYRIALLMVANGVAEPEALAKRTLEKPGVNMSADLSNLPYSAMPKEPDDETGWVIEASGPKYWNGHGIGVECFTDKHEDAMRFARHQDGEVVRCRLLEKLYPLLTTREHKWLKPKAR